MFGMFDFLNDMGNYEERKIARYESENLIISTCAVSDSFDPYETAISHPDYNDGKWIIVETYTDPDDAALGHQKWVISMEVGELPESLDDRSRAKLVMFAAALGLDVNETHLRSESKTDDGPTKTE